MTLFAPRAHPFSERVFALLLVLGLHLTKWHVEISGTRLVRRLRKRQPRKCVHSHHSYTLLISCPLLTLNSPILEIEEHGKLITTSPRGLAVAFHFQLTSQSNRAPSSLALKNSKLPSCGRSKNKVSQHPKRRFTSWKSSTLNADWAASKRQETNH